MRKPSRSTLSVRKASYYAIAANGLQVLLMVGIAVHVLLSDTLRLGETGTRVVVICAALAVAAGAALDIRNAISTRRLLERIDSMTDTLANMEQFNITLRVQRHDFLNHLQVVYSLMEMNDYPEAVHYIEKVYGSITAVSKVMKTANASVNALLQVKAAACEKAGIPILVNIRSSWKALPMPGWEMCRVLSNLIDNAMDALAGVRDPQLSLTLTEDLRTLRFRIVNNGPQIPEELRSRIFEAGVTTKSDGHGMGLYIVRSTLREWGGDIDLIPAENETVFEGWVPRAETPVSPIE